MVDLNRQGFIAATRVKRAGYVAAVPAREIVIAPSFSSFAHPQPGSEGAFLPYTCGHCEADVAGMVPSFLEDVRWLYCPKCGDGSVRGKRGLIYPPAPFGPRIDGLPNDIESAYEEARRSMGVGAYTACELICRKILMHVAVDKGAKERASFASYLKHLEAEAYITPPMKKWVDLIRDHGNASTHRLPAPDKSRAESTLMFTAELLRLVYEMDSLAQRYTPKDAEETT